MSKKKKIILTVLTLCFASLISISAFAGTDSRLKQGHWIDDETGRRWLYEDGSLPDHIHSVWLDGDDDGVYQKYSFNEEGYVYINTDFQYTDMNGHLQTMDAEGAMVIDGVRVDYQPKRAWDVGSDLEDENYDAQGVSRLAKQMIAQSREENAVYGETAVEEDSDSVDVTYANGFKLCYHKIGDATELWMDSSRSDINNSQILKFFYESTIDNRVDDTWEKQILCQGLGLNIISNATQTFDSVWIAVDDTINLYWYCTNKMFMFRYR